MSVKKLFKMSGTVALDPERVTMEHEAETVGAAIEAWKARHPRGHISSIIAWGHCVGCQRDGEILTANLCVDCIAASRSGSLGSSGGEA